MSTMGIIFSDIHSWSIAELTAHRTVASIPFAGRYRLVDFALSNMVNSDIYKIGIITKSNYQSLVDHIASGKDWDLSRKNGGITILPPYIIGGQSGPYKGRLDALVRIKRFIESANADYVVLSDCDVIFNIDFDDIVAAHRKSCADITAVYSRCNIARERAQHSIIYGINESGRITDMLLNPDIEGEQNVSLNSWVMSKDYLLSQISNAATHGFTNFFKYMLLENVKYSKIMSFCHEGYNAHIESLSSYVEANMDMIDKKNRSGLFYVSGRPIHTKVRDSSPTKYGSNACVKNSFIADGCVIEGNVENSVLFRGVKISAGSTVKNCILMQDTLIENNASLSWIISDKNVIVRDNRVLSGDINYPFYIAKGRMV